MILMSLVAQLRTYWTIFLPGKIAPAFHTLVFQNFLNFTNKMHLVIGRFNYSVHLPRHGKIAALMAVWPIVTVKVSDGGRKLDNKLMNRCLLIVQLEPVDWHPFLVVIEAQLYSCLVSFNGFDGEVYLCIIGCTPSQQALDPPRLIAILKNH